MSESQVEQVYDGVQMHVVIVDRRSSRNTSTAFLPWPQSGPEPKYVASPNMLELAIADADQRPISCLPRPGPGRIVLNAEVEPVMAGVCDICGKTKSFGHNVSHSKRRTNRDFRPNVQRKRLLIGNELVRLNVCTRCMRTAQKGSR